MNRVNSPQLLTHVAQRDSETANWMAKRKFIEFGDDCRQPSRVESHRIAPHRMFCAYHRNTSVNKTELLDTRTLETQTS